MMLAAAISLLLATAPEAALRSALDSSADWTMERRLGERGRTLRSSGVVYCTAGLGIVWKVLEPFDTTITMTTNSMIFVDEDGKRVKPLADLPHYAEIRERTDAFAAGDRKAFDGMFRLEESCFADGGWKLKLKPEVKAMERLLREIEVSGADKPTNVVMRTGDGGCSTIRFKERVRAR